MKRLIFIFFTLLIALSSYSQTFPVEFMGIPVDGTRKQMMNAIKQKGFSYNPNTDLLTGQFDGLNVCITVQDNKDKVFRVVVFNKTPFTEDGVRGQFNRLIQEFEDNDKYVNPYEDLSYSIPVTEDISSEMILNNKQYAAIYYQNIDYTNPTTRSKLSRYIDENVDITKIDSLTEEEKNNKIIELSNNIFKGILQKRPVWLKIHKEDDGYYIAIFYENLYNTPHGEDL